MSAYDIIVVGVGGMGSAACWRMARRGARVLGLEASGIPNEHGSSHGQTRITRKAYFEHPDYVPLLHRAYDLWSDLELETDAGLRQHCGVLLGGPPDGAVVSGVRRSAEIHGIAVQSIQPSELAARFPGFAVPEAHEVLFEPDAGIMLVERCVEAMAAAARRHGAELREGCKVTAVEPAPDGVVVRCDGERLQAGHVVLAAGAWTSGVLSELGTPLTILRKVQLWFEEPDRCYRLDTGCPVFGFETADGAFVYGMPIVDVRGMKAAEHSGRQIVDHPAHLDRNLFAADHQRVEALLQPYLGRRALRLCGHSVCMYTMTPDEHFVVDRHPKHPRVLVAAGFSGHGFKFAPLVGEVLTDLALEGETQLPVGFLAITRSGLRGPPSE